MGANQRLLVLTRKINFEVLESHTVQSAMQPFIKIKVAVVGRQLSNR